MLGLLAYGSTCGRFVMRGVIQLTISQTLYAKFFIILVSSPTRAPARPAPPPPVTGSEPPAQDGGRDEPRGQAKKPMKPALSPRRPAPPPRSAEKDTPLRAVPSGRPPPPRGALRGGTPSPWTSTPLVRDGGPLGEGNPAPRGNGRGRPRGRGKIMKK